VLGAVLLGWFAIATILGETFTPKPAYFTQESTPRSDQLIPGSLTERLAAAAPLRGDLLSRIAFDRSAQLLKPGNASVKGPASPELLATRTSALSYAKQSLSLAPHSSATWLLLAKLQSLASDPNSAVEALRMSYLTASSDFDLIPARLEVFAAVATSADTDLADLARGDIRLILTRRPDLKTAISSAYQKGSGEGKSAMYDIVAPLDPSFAGTLR
jgi:hypothetical protein